jgi:hypothetical protein
MATFERCSFARLNTQRAVSLHAADLILEDPTMEVMQQRTIRNRGVL